MTLSYMKLNMTLSYMKLNMTLSYMKLNSIHEISLNTFKFKSINSNMIKDFKGGS